MENNLLMKNLTIFLILMVYGTTESTHILQKKMPKSKDFGERLIMQKQKIAVLVISYTNTIIFGLDIQRWLFVIRESLIKDFRF